MAKPKAEHTHASLVDVAVRWLRNTRGCTIVFAEMTYWDAPINPDALGWMSGGWSVLVEVKVSRSDFLADRAKPIHKTPHTTPGQERWYMAPAGLLRIEDMPSGWRLAEVSGRTVTIADGKRCTRHYAGLMLGRQAAEHPFLLAAIRRHHLGVPFDKGRGRFETVATALKREAADRHQRILDERAARRAGDA